MADEDTLASINDGLAEAIASIPAEQQPAAPEGEDKAEAPAPSDGRPRDEHGRFAPKGQDEPPEAPADGQDQRDEPGGQIPSWRLREIREERDRIAARAEAAERRAWELEQQQLQWQAWQRQQYEAQQAQQEQAPDPISDPSAYHQYMMSVLDRRLEAAEQQRVREMQAAEQKRIDDRVNWSCQAASKQHGELFEKAFSLLERHPERDRIVAEMVTPAVNPGEAILRWGKRQMAMQEVGDDLEGYHKKLREQWKKDPEFRKEFMAELDIEARGNSGRSSEANIHNLPSVNRAPGGGARQTMGELGQTDGEIFANLTRKRGR